MLQAIPTSISILNSARLTAKLGPELMKSGVVFNVTYLPFPLTSIEVGIGIFIAAQTQALYVASGFTIIAGMVASRVVLERELGVKNMQFMMGISRVMYWLSFFLFDFVLYLISAALSLTLLVIINPSASKVIIVFVLCLFVNIIRTINISADMPNALYYFTNYTGIWRYTNAFHRNHGPNLWSHDTNVCIRCFFPFSEAHNCTDLHFAYLHFGSNCLARDFLCIIVSNSPCSTMGPGYFQLYSFDVSTLCICSCTYKFGLQDAMSSWCS